MITRRFAWRSTWAPADFCWPASKRLPISMSSAMESICRRAAGDVPEGWRQEFEDHFLVLPQIETRRGLENAAGIAAHELTTAMAIGPYDLSAELGVCGDMDSPILREALASIRATGDSAGKSTWMIGSNAAQLARDGWRFICIGEPTWILMSALRDNVAQARDSI
jgi:2-keto-3-deoxy-L-rhamnonate aldolase RhmA